MSDPIVVVGAARTPIGRYAGSLAGVDAYVLGATAVASAIERAGLDRAAEVDEVVMGCIAQIGPDSYNARRVALRPAYPTAPPRSTSTGSVEADSRRSCPVRWNCRSGTAPSSWPEATRACRGCPSFFRRHVPGMHWATAPSSMARWPSSRTRERPAHGRHCRERRAGVRSVADRAGLVGAPEPAADGRSNGGGAFRHPDRSSVRARAPRCDHRGDHRRAPPTPSTTAEALAALRPAFDREGTVTAGNSSGINDGGAAVVLMRESEARAKGHTPLARLVDWASGAMDPQLMGVAPVIAVERVLARTSMSIADLGVVELNEAFASQVVAVHARDRHDPRAGESARRGDRPRTSGRRYRCHSHREARARPA